MKINVVTLCSGYDSQCMALDELKKQAPDFDYDLVAWSEIDRDAIKMHNLVYPEYKDRNVGDMTKVDWQRLKDEGMTVDLCTYSTPCQDVSQAGKQAGIAEGDDTRSAILWKTEELIKVFRPKYLMQENVKALVSQTFIGDFHKWESRVNSYGYRSFAKVLNAKDYGVPQNRERIIMISIREDVLFNFKFPRKQKLEVLLKDILEKEVDERFFLNDESVGKFLKANDKDNAVFVQMPYSPDHESAMFIKTWIRRFMDNLKLWDKTPTELAKDLEEIKEGLPDDWRHSVWMEDPEFVAEWEWNCMREEGDPEWTDKDKWLEILFKMQAR